MNGVWRNAKDCLTQEWVSAPFVTSATDGLKQNLVPVIERWYKKTHDVHFAKVCGSMWELRTRARGAQTYCWPHMHLVTAANTAQDKVFFFDDREDNVKGFAGTGYNAKQVSCASRDWGQLWLGCGCGKAPCTGWCHKADDAFPRLLGFCGGAHEELLEPELGVRACGESVCRGPPVPGTAEPIGGYPKDWPMSTSPEECPKPRPKLEPVLAGAAGQRRLSWPPQLSPPQLSPPQATSSRGTPASSRRAPSVRGRAVKATSKLMRQQLKEEEARANKHADEAQAEYEAQAENEARETAGAVRAIEAIEQAEALALEVEEDALRALPRAGAINQTASTLIAELEAVDVMQTAAGSAHEAHEIIAELAAAAEQRQGDPVAERLVEELGRGGGQGGAAQAWLDIQLLKEVTAAAEAEAAATAAKLAKQLEAAGEHDIAVTAQQLVHDLNAVAAMGAGATPKAGAGWQASGAKPGESLRADDRPTAEAGREGGSGAHPRGAYPHTLAGEWRLSTIGAAAAVGIGLATATLLLIRILLRWVYWWLVHIFCCGWWGSKEEPRASRRYGDRHHDRYDAEEAMLGRASDRSLRAALATSTDLSDSEEEEEEEEENEKEEEVEEDEGEDEEEDEEEEEEEEEDDEEEGEKAEEVPVMKRATKSQGKGTGPKKKKAVADRRAAAKPTEADLEAKLKAEAEADLKATVKARRKSAAEEEEAKAAAKAAEEARKKKEKIKKEKNKKAVARAAAVAMLERGSAGGRMYDYPSYDDLE